jgi:hypothetical protein
MSTREGLKSINKSERKRRREPAENLKSTMDIASYVATITRGVRELTRKSNQKDLVFLDNLLAIVEEEASALSAHVYH